MKLSVIATAIAALFMQGAIAAPPEVKWDSTSLIINGKRVMPVSGEIHYSRLPADEWRREIKKMKEGGVTIIATYVFWNHIEETEIFAAFLRHAKMRKCRSYSVSGLSATVR